MKTFDGDDTIVALATAAGVGAIAVIRLSGPRAIEIGDSIFLPKRKNGKRLAMQKSHTLHFGDIMDNQESVDEVLIALMKSPHSYTGEDSVEISCHGSMYIQQKIIQVCRNKGARLAGPGEFTMRAFLNGKMDLSQAEAVADLIASDTSTSHSLAMKQMRGGFSNEIKILRDELIHFASLIELELDFAEEDVEFANRDELKNFIVRVMTKVSALLNSFELGNVIRKGIPVVIAGKPNAGKSTLLNALLNEERAIVSHIAGTTRDTIEEEIVLDGIKFRFIDTAGLRQTNDVIEKIGVSKTFEKINESPVVLYIFDVIETDASTLKHELDELKNTIEKNVRIIPVGNKIDASVKIETAFHSIPEIIFISAKDKTNIDQLKNILHSIYMSGQIDSNNSIVTSERHAGALKRTYDALSSVYAGLSTKVTNDFIAADLREALRYLGEISGEISTDDFAGEYF